MKKLSFLVFAMFLLVSGSAFGAQSEEELCKLFSGTWKYVEFKMGRVGGAELTEEEIEEMEARDDEQRVIIGKFDKSTKKCTLELVDKTGEEVDVSVLKMDGKKYPLELKEVDEEYAEFEDPNSKAFVTSSWVENKRLDEGEEILSHGKQINILIETEASGEGDTIENYSSRLLITIVDQNAMRLEALFTGMDLDEEQNIVKVNYWIKSKLKRVK